MLFASVAVVLLLAADFASGGMLRAAARSLGSVVWSGSTYAQSVFFGGGYFSSKRALSAEIESLREALTARAAEDGRLEILEKENLALRALASLAANEEGIAAPIISSTSASPYGTFAIGVGGNDGVKVGDAVLAADRRGYFLGRIAEVRAKSALVKELFAPGERIDARVGDAELSLEGRGGSNARSEVPPALSISKGDTVTSALFPGRIIGLVGSVSEEEGSGLKRVYVRSPLRIPDLLFVYVVRNHE